MRFTSIILLLTLSMLPHGVASADMPFQIIGYGLSEGAGWVLTARALYLTADEGRTWRNVAPDLPDAAFLAADVLPDGPIWVVARDTESPTLILARTADFGRHWASTPLASLVPPLPIAEIELDVVAPDASTLRARYASSANFARWSTWRTADGGETWAALATDVIAPRTAQPDEAVYAANGQDGWRLTQQGNCRPSGSARICTQSAALLATHDGGQTWAGLPLPDGLGQVYESAVAIGGAEVGAAAIGERTTIAVGQGFDKCDAATLDQLYNWRWSSPYSSVNLYFGGSLRACANARLTADYLRAASAMGWTFIPTWVGPQAPCTAFRSRISWDANTAWGQGWAEGQAAADALSRLGLTAGNGGSIAYYDMEAYSGADTACHAAVKSFILGWDQALRARGHLAGVYGLGSMLGQLVTIAQPPDAIWAAHWIYTGYTPWANVWDVYALGDDVWVGRQRLRQYTGGHWETWGGISLNIDSNALEGPVSAIDPPSPTPTSTPTATATRVIFTPSVWVYLPIIMR